MKVLSYSALRSNLKAVLDAVVMDADITIIPRGDDDAVVMVPLRQWNSMTETLHVLGDRGTTRRLLDSMDELDAGRGVTVELEIPEVSPERAAA